MSVGAFYYRFRSKDEFIYTVTATTFRAATNNAKGHLTSDRWGRALAEKTVRGFVRHVVIELGERKNAGVLRAAFKLEPKMPAILEPIREYRATVTQCARGLFGRHLRAGQSPCQIDAAVQIIFGTIIDAILEQPGPLRIGSGAMIDALSDVVLRYLEFSGNRVWSGTKDEKEESEPAPDAAIADSEDGQDKNSKGRVAIDYVDLRKNIGSVAMPAARPRKRRQSRTERPMQKVATVDPKMFRPSPPAKSDASSNGRRAKRRIV